MPTLRDSTVTEERYNKAIEKFLSDIDFSINLSKEKNRLSIMHKVPRDYVRIGIAVYSKGGDIKDVKTFFSKAIDARIKFCDQLQSPFNPVDEGSYFKPEDGWSMFDDLMYVLPAAYFANRISDIRKYFFADSFLNVKKKVIKNSAALCAQLILIMEKKSIKTVPIDFTAFNSGAFKSWAPLVPLLQAVSDNNSSVFGECLQEYLKKDWNPYFNKAKKKAYQTNETSLYIGHYNLLTGVLCSIMNFFPSVPKELDFIFRD